MDPSGTMIAEAKARFGAVSEFVQGDGTQIPLADGAFDAVFSAATFHWIKDHDSLFREIHRVLKRGGRLVSQCGGGPNLQRLYRRARELRNTDPYAPWFEHWADPWNFATPEETGARLERSRFVDVAVSLEPAQTPFPDVDAYAAFVATVCLRQHLERLPGDLRESFVRELSEAAAADDPPLTLDYWRLNIDARRG